MEEFPAGTAAAVKGVSVLAAVVGNVKGWATASSADCETPWKPACFRSMSQSLPAPGIKENSPSGLSTRPDDPLTPDVMITR